MTIKRSASTSAAIELADVATAVFPDLGLSSEFANCDPESVKSVTRLVNFRCNLPGGAHRRMAEYLAGDPARAHWKMKLINRQTVQLADLQSMEFAGHSKHYLLQTPREFWVVFDQVLADLNLPSSRFAALLSYARGPMSQPSWQTEQDICALYRAMRAKGYSHRDLIS